MFAQATPPYDPPIMTICFVGISVDADVTMTNDDGNEQCVDVECECVIEE